MDTPSASRIRVLVVDDSAVSRRLISQALCLDPEIDVVGFAENGRLALESVASDPPDAIVLDLAMPEMDGFETLRQLKVRFNKIPVLVFSSTAQRGASATVEALLAGAADYAFKPSTASGSSLPWETARLELSSKLRAMAARAQRAAPRPAVVEAPESRRPTAAPKVPVRAVAIGCSVGGPEALATLIPRLSAGLRVPIFIVQHMPSSFTAQLAKRLTEKSSVPVLEASHGQTVQSGTVYLAPGDYHLRVARRQGGIALHLDQGPLENGCRPSVDPLFCSAAEIYGNSLLTVVLTGMGFDGLVGARAVTAAGGNVWVQDEASAMVWGMAGAVSRAGLARRTCPLITIAPSIEAAIARGLPPVRPQSEPRT